MALQNSTLQDLRDLTFALIGREYANTTASYARINALWNQGAKMAHKKTDWWERYLIVGEPRTIIANRIQNTEDAFFISSAGEAEVNGFYQYGPEYSGHNSYVLNGNTLSFEVTSSSLNSDIVGTYKLDASYEPTGNGYSRGVWVNQTNGKIVFVQNSTETNWIILNIATDTVLFSLGSGAFFPWQAGFNGEAVISGNPETAYNIERNDSNNHWELMQQDADGATVLYKDGNGNTPSETTWEIVNAPNPTPIVEDISTIEVLLRLHKTQPFIDKGAAEHTFYAKNSSYFVQGSSVGEVAYATYKKRLDVELATDDAVSTEIPAEFMPYMAHYAAYTWQRSVDQNSDEANFGLSLAIVNQVLEDELVKIDKQNLFNTTVARRYRTNYNSTII